MKAPIQRFAALLLLTLSSAANSSGADAIPIYGDTRETGWDNWSWSSSIDWGHSSDPFEGQACIRLVLNAWGALSLYSGNGIETAPFEGITFHVRSDEPGITLNISFEDPANKEKSSNLTFSKQGFLDGTEIDSEWRQVNIPFSSVPNMPSRRLLLPPFSVTHCRFSIAALNSEGDTRILNAWLAYGRSYRIESSVDHTHWEQITILPGTDGLLRFPLPKDDAGESTATAYRITPL